MCGRWLTLLCLVTAWSALTLPDPAWGQAGVPRVKQLGPASASQAPAPPAPLERVRITNTSGQDLEVQLLPSGQDPATGQWTHYAVPKGTAISVERATAQQFALIRILTEVAGGAPHAATYTFSPDSWYELFANPVTKAWDIRRVPAG
ncbi:MAG TPA: hypothetical protein VL359_04560 [bacterium]|nr:hypothetical protein [bacterium]